MSWLFSCFIPSSVCNRGGVGMIVCCGLGVALCAGLVRFGRAATLRRVRRAGSWRTPSPPKGIPQGWDPSTCPQVRGADAGSTPVKRIHNRVLKQEDSPAKELGAGVKTITIMLDETSQPWTDSAVMIDFKVPQV